MLKKTALFSRDGFPNYCSECDKAFRYNSLLKHHLKLHENKKGKPLSTFKEKRFSQAFKSKVSEFAENHSVKSACREFGLADSSVRSILKSGLVRKFVEAREKTQ